MLEYAYYKQLGLQEIYSKVVENERISCEDGLVLFACKNIVAVGALAHKVRLRMHGLKTWYVPNRHINYSNICVNGCSFCAFEREEGTEGAFCLTHEEILERLKGGSEFAEVHIVGGCHPSLKLDWFESLLQKVQKACPNAHIKAFTAEEIFHFAQLNKISVQDVLQRLKKAGLAALTGGGAEIFNESIRPQICANKCTGNEWLAVAGEAHKLGIPSNCSMLYGHVETMEHRVEHLDRLRKQQDATGGFNCFIPLPFQTKHNKLAKDARFSDEASGVDRLKTIAVSRLMLDSIPHIKSYWVMMGLKLAQCALWYGADDLDGTIVEEKIGHMAGAQSSAALTRQQLEQSIKNSGFEPVCRDALYNQVG